MHGIGSLRDKVAIVTGGASGIGRSLCMSLAANGAVVMVADVNADGANNLASKILKSGGRAHAAELDVSHAAKVESLIEATVAKYGRLDLIFNNAGLGFRGEVKDMEPVHWRRLVDVDFWGVVNGSTAAYAAMIDQGFGHIVNVASLAGLVPVPTIAAYAAVKHAIVGFTNSLRAEAASFGVKVSVVCPGPIATSFYYSLMMPYHQEHRRPPPQWAIDPEVAAKAILRGVARNRGIIVFPFRARMTWLCYRLFPWEAARVHRKIIRNFRDRKTNLARADVEP